jgi:hypothetical protein
MVCTLAEMFFRSFYWWDSSSRQRKVRENAVFCENILSIIEKLSAVFSFPMIAFMPGMWRMHS